MGDGKRRCDGTSHELGRTRQAFGPSSPPESGALAHVWQTSGARHTQVGVRSCHGTTPAAGPSPSSPSARWSAVFRGGDWRPRPARSGTRPEGARRPLRLDAASIRLRRRAVDWELKGVPLRVEVGPRDLANGEVTVVRRDRADKTQARIEGLAAGVPALLEQIQADLLAEATAARDARTIDVTNADDAAAAATDGFARLPWAAVGVEGETRLREQASPCVPDTRTDRCHQEDQKGTVAMWIGPTNGFDLRVRFGSPSVGVPRPSFMETNIRS